MAKSDAENNNLESELKRAEALAEKLSKTDTAFGARFTELMNFSKSITATEQALQKQADLNKEELERLDKRIKQLSEKAISGLTIKVETLEKTIDKHKERVDEYIKRIDSPLERLSRDQASLLHRFNLLDQALNQENKFQKTIIWIYRCALMATALFFVYYHFSLTKDITSININLSNLPEKILENKQPKPQIIPDNKFPPDIKPKSNKK